MRTIRAGGIDALNKSQLDGATIDLAVNARYGQPAVNAAPVFPSGGEVGPSDQRFSYSGTWSSGATTTPGSSASFTWIGFAAQLSLVTGPLQGIAFVTLDGSPRLAVDTYSASPGVIQYTVASPTFRRHTLVLTYYGDIDASVTPLTQPVNTTGTSVAPLLAVTRDYRGATVAGTHTITATGAGTVSIDGSGSYATGTSVDSVVPGVTLFIGSGALTTGDAATFTVQATGISIQGVTVATDQENGAGLTSAILDGCGFALAGPGDTPLALPMVEPDSISVPLQWVVAVWDQDPNFPVVSGWAMTGDGPDQSQNTWYSCLAASPFDRTKLNITQAVYSDGTGQGYMGLGILPRGRYCQVHVDLPEGGFVRGLRCYCWDVDSDGDRDRFAPLPDDDLFTRLLAAQVAVATMDLRDPFRETVSSFAYGSAMGRWADLRGQEWQLPRPYGIDDAVYASLLRFLSAAGGSGATYDFINNALRTILGPNAPFSVVAQATTTVQWVLGEGHLGTDTYLQATNVGAFQATIFIPVASLGMPPQVIQSVMELFRPIGLNVTYWWQ